MFPAVVSADWLHAHIGKAALRVYDCTFHSDLSVEQARAAFAEAHLPSALQLLLRTDDRPPEGWFSCIPKPHVFGKLVTEAGLSRGLHCVFYDTDGMSAYRAWWLLNYYGHSKVSILIGGMPAWVEKGYAIEGLVDSGVDGTTGRVAGGMGRSVGASGALGATGPLASTGGDLTLQALQGGRRGLGRTSGQESSSLGDSQLAGAAGLQQRSLRDSRITMYMEELAPMSSSRLMSSSGAGGFIQPGLGSASAPRTAFSAQPVAGALVSSRLVREFVVRRAESAQEELYSRFPRFFTVIDDTDIVLNSTTVVARLEMGDSRVVRNQAFRVRQLVDVRPLLEEMDGVDSESGEAGENGARGSGSAVERHEGREHHEGSEEEENGRGIAAGLADRPGDNHASFKGAASAGRGSEDSAHETESSEELSTEAHPGRGRVGPQVAAPASLRRILALDPIPFAARIPYLTFLDSSGSIISNVLVLRGIFREAGIDPSQDITFYGASGFETSIACFAAFLSSGQSFTRYTVMSDGLDAFWRKYGDEGAGPETGDEVEGDAEGGEEDAAEGKAGDEARAPEGSGISE